jgi:hypothetical protein
MRTAGCQLPFPRSPTTVVSRVAARYRGGRFLALTGGQALASHVRCGDTLTADRSAQMPAFRLTRAW